MKNIATVLAFILTAALADFAQAAEEAHLSYDLFGVYGTRDKDGDDEDAFGLGAGLNYFFAGNWGAGLDTYTDGIRLPYMLNASAIYRFATKSVIDPYAYAGFGRQWKHAPQWTAHIGGGAEYNWKSGMAFFLDGRLVVPDETSNYGLFRLGVRVGF